MAKRAGLQRLPGCGRCSEQVLLRLLLMALLLAAMAVQPNHATAAMATGPSRIVAGMLADAQGEPVFALGVNYEGPQDRAWHMWDAGQFDPALIAADLARARAANIQVVRVFLQAGLLADLRAGHWDKLDRFLDLADQHGLQVILTLADYPASNVADLAAVAGQVAAHEQGRDSILSLDLKNEPHFGDLALASYPAGSSVPLQDPARVAQVGETIARADIPAYRASPEGRQRIPARLSDDQAYVYANLLGAYLQFVAEAQAWATSHHQTVVDYTRSPDSARWSALKDALDATLAAWLQPQVAAVRAADPTRLVTLAQVDPFLASLSSNDLLDYRTFHRYPTASAAGVAQALALFDAVKAADPAKPLILGEFGISNDTTSEADSASLEAALVRGVRDHGGAGALKWMLTDVPAGGNAKQDAFGMYRGDGSPKPVVAAFQALGQLTPEAVPPPPPPAPAASASAPPTQAAPAPATDDGRSFAETGFRVDNDAIWSLFQTRGKLAVFGYPISRTFSLLGCTAQMFQRQVVQVCADGQPRLMNLLDPDIFPYTHLNGSTLPPPDPALKQATPSVSDPQYATKIIDFVRATAPDTALGQPVNFGQTFFTAIDPSSVDATAPGLLPLVDLEVWGAPISRPTPDPNNAGFIYQRFQRGIMHYIAAQHTTQSILVGDYLKQLIINSPDLPPDLRQEARGSRFLAQYCPQNDTWRCRPAALPATDFTNAFTPDA